MDIDAAIVGLAESLNDADWDDAMKYAHNIADWLNKGGHMPTNPDVMRHLMLCIATMAACQE